ncbi:MAG: glycoside hydrolase family 16 protein [Chthoniobacteraceae bacterium]
MSRFLAALLFIASIHVFADEPVTAESRGYRLAWSDEFDKPALDGAKWNTSFAPKVHPIGCNNEKQVYAPENVMVRSGQLVLRAERKPREGLPFTSGMISSHDKFSQRYGWFEARIHVPRGPGLWPAFWLLPDDRSWPPEIDIMEHKGRFPDRVWMTLHLPQPGTWRSKSSGGEWAGPDFTASIHTFAVEWEPGSIRWYIDGIERQHVGQTTPDVPMYVILNLAVGGDWDGDPDAETAFPAEMWIEWVRVYRRP